MSDINGLLLLWYAAVDIEGSDIKKMIIQARNRRNHSLKLLKSRDSSYSQTNKRSQVPIRHSHNELEKCRRAHLRLCMEKLKKVLRFDQESVPCRITMLNVLKKASTTIYDRERSIHMMNAKETMAKSRFVELTNRLNNLQRQQKRLKSIQANSIESDKAERMRNFSECSILTTSSDDSAFDSARSRQLSINFSNIYVNNSPVNNNNNSNDKDEELSKFLRLSAIRDDHHSSTGVNRTVFKCSSPNSNSCDSGFEETQHSNNNINNSVNKAVAKPIFVNSRKSDSINKIVVYNDTTRSNVGKDRSFVTS